jgi:hypothetical protein
VGNQQGFGVRVDDREAEDYHYRWRATGEMLGVELAAIPTDLAHAAELTELIAHRNHRRGEEGVEMTRALFALHANTLPRTRWDRAMGRHAGVWRALDCAQPPRGPVGSIPVPPELERHWTAGGVFPSIDSELIRIAQAEPA